MRLTPLCGDLKTDPTGSTFRLLLESSRDTEIAAAALPGKR
jgi:hypothetical protein